MPSLFGAAAHKRPCTFYPGISGNFVTEGTKCVCLHTTAVADFPTPKINSIRPADRPDHGQPIRQPNAGRSATSAEIRRPNYRRMADNEKEIIPATSLRRSADKSQRCR